MLVLMLCGLALGLHGVTIVWVERMRRRTRPARLWLWFALVLGLLTGWHGWLALAALAAQPEPAPTLPSASVAVLVAGGLLLSLSRLLAWVEAQQEEHGLAQQAAAEAQHQQQAAFDALLDAVPVEIRITDTAQRLIRLNSAAATAEGVAATDLEGAAWWQHTSGTTPAPTYSAEDRAILRTGEPQRGVLRMRPSATGTPRWLHVDTFPYHTAQGQIAGLVECAMDVTAYQQTAAALARRIAQLHTVHTIAEELTRELDFPRLLQLIVQRAADLLGATKSVLYLWEPGTQTLRPQAWRDAPDWFGELRLKLGEGVAGLVAERCQGLLVDDRQQAPYAPPTHIVPDGPAATLAEPLLYRDQLLGVLVVTQLEPAQAFYAADREPLATLAAQAAVAMENARLFRESRQRQAWLANILDINKRIATHDDMERLVEQIADEAARLIDADGSLLRLLQGEQQITVGATALHPARTETLDLPVSDGIVGRTVLEDRIFMVPDVQTYPDVASAWKQRAAQAGIQSLLSIPMRGRDGVLGVLIVTSQRPRLFTDDEMTVLSSYAEQGAIAIEHARLWAAEERRLAEVERTNTILRTEIAERQRIEEERLQLITALEARSAEMERFTYTVSHDLKSPLITIQGFLGLLEQDALAGDAERMRGDITYIHNAADTMQRLLNELLELSRIGRVVHAPSCVALSDLAQEAATLVTGQISARGVQVVIAPDLPALLGDRQRLLEVLQNLLDNAVKFMGQQPQPRVEIGACVHEGEVRCYVRDNGIGIEPRYHDKIFGLFERLDATSDGTGIGLTLVKRIIEVHGGRIWVESAGSGHGSTFYFTLPAAPIGEKEGCHG